MDSTTRLIDNLLGKQKNSKYSSKSPEPNDGNFIVHDPNGSFNANGTCRYGEVQDVDDL